jgi:hypothetical protein
MKFFEPIYSTNIYLKSLKMFFRFDNVRIPRENLLNSVADVSPDGKYLSAIENPDQVIIFPNRKYLLLYYLTTFFSFWFGWPSSSLYHIAADIV